jgi:hypothetical protein
MSGAATRFAAIGVLAVLRAGFFIFMAVVIHDALVYLMTHHIATRTVMSQSTRNTGKPWTPSDVRELRDLAARNTPTWVIGLKLRRPPEAVQAKASKEGILLRPANQAPESRRKT